MQRVRPCLNQYISELNQMLPPGGAIRLENRERKLFQVARKVLGAPDKTAHDEPYTWKRHAYEKLNALSEKRTVFKLLTFPARWLLGLQDREVISCAKRYIAAIDNLEQHPVRVDGGEQPFNHTPWVETADKIEKLFACSRSKEIRQLGAQIKFKALSLQYRIGEKNKVDRANIDEALVEKFVQKAQEWKKAPKQRHLPSYELNQQEREIIVQACQYPELVGCLLENNFFCDDFFKYTIQKLNLGESDVSAFFEFSGRLKSLGKVLHSYTHGTIQVVEESGKKYLKLPFEIQQEDGTCKTEYHSVLNDHAEYNLKHNWKLSLEKIVQYFEMKVDNFGPLDFVDDVGIRNFNNLEMCTWHPGTQTKEYVKVVDSQGVVENNWWEKIVPQAVLTLEEAQKIYGDQLNGQNCGVSAVANITDLDGKDPIGAHIYIEVAIPQSNVAYAIHRHSKYGREYPLTIIDWLKGLAGTHKANIVIDKSDSYYHRKHFRVANVVTMEEAKNGLDFIAHSIDEGQRDLLPFQFQSNPCARWVVEALNKFKDKPWIRERDVMTDFYKPEYKNPLTSGMNKVCKLFPKKWRSIAFKVVFAPFFPGRELNGYSLKKDGWLNGVTRDGKQNKFPIYFIGKLFIKMLEELEGARDPDYPTLFPLKEHGIDPFKDPLIKSMLEKRAKDPKIQEQIKRKKAKIALKQQQKAAS